MRICLLLAAVGGARARLAQREREKARLTSVRHHRRLSDSSSFEQLVKRTAADAAAYDNFGFSVAIDGNTVVSGAPGCYMSWCPAVSGSVYVLRASDGEELAKLTAADAAAGDFFGESVAIDRDTVVVGARGDNNVTGAVYVFRTTDGGASYGQVTKLTAADAAAGDFFGHSVAIDGDTVVVGARGDNNVTGAVYVFRASDGEQLAKLTATDGAAGDHFGHSVAIDGDTVVVGARGVNSVTGAAYVFHTTDGWDTHTEIKLTASDGASEDLFGQSVAIDGAAGAVVVGASQSRKTGGTGAAYVFRTTDGGATYGQLAKLTAADAAAGDGFGWSVAIDSGTIVVGAYGDDDAAGAAYVFRTSDDGIVYSKLTASDAAADDQFGVSVAIDGATVVVGAYQDGDAGIGSGSAYVFRTNDGSATYDQVAKLTASDGAVNDAFGISVAIDGATVVVGAAQWLNAGSGSAYVFEEDSSDYLSSDATRALPATMIFLAAGAAAMLAF